MANRLTLSVLGCLILFGISACSKPVQQIQVSTKPIDKPELTLPYADPIQTRDVEWIIVTADNYEKVFADLKRNGQDVVLFSNVPVGIFPLQVDKIYSTGTGASAMLALY